DELNQGAAQLAKTYDPEEQRTIGNADPEQNNPEAVAYWQERVRNSANCFCVRQPGRSNTGLHWTDARRQETIFFETHWYSLFNDPITRNRLGTDNLREYLATRLYEWILKRLPDLQKKARLRLHQMEVELESLPKPVDNPIRYMDNLIWEFNRKIEQATDIHKFHNPPLAQACRVRLEEFDDTLVYQLHPRFRPFSREVSRKGAMKDYREEHATPAEVPQMSRNIQVPEPVYLEEVMARSNERGREVPGNYPYGVKKDLMEKSISMWRKETDEMLDDISQMISSTLQNIISEYFGPYKASGLEDIVSSVTAHPREYLC
ncbi:15600_t:CDS:2, partial [Acaulospora colombiana]